MLPLASQAQFYYVTNNGAITITGYYGPGGDVDFPDMIDGLPVVDIENPEFSSGWPAYMAITNPTLPATITNLGIGAFYFCTDLTSINIPEGISIIQMWAFGYCGSLTNITIPNSATMISQDAFYSCGSLTNVLIGTNVIGVAYEAFAGTGLSSIALPVSVSNIDPVAFDSCFNLTSINIDPQNSHYCSEGGVLFDKNRTSVVRCPPGMQGNYVIPTTVTTIGDDAFRTCGFLTMVIIPNGVLSLGNYSFRECNALTNMAIPDSVVSLGIETCYTCGSLTNVSIGQGITDIPVMAFSYCSLTTITFPSSVTSVGEEAFGNNPLKTVYCLGNSPFQFFGDPFIGLNVTVYYLPGTGGWDPFLWRPPLVPWTLPNPLILNSVEFGIQSNQFGFTVSWATNASVVVEASTDLINPVWSPVITNALSGGIFYFSDPHWTNYPSRFYRVRSQQYE